MTARIVISEVMDEAAVATLRGHADVHYDPALVDDPERLAALGGDADALIVRNRTQVRGALLDAFGAVRVIGRLGVGLDNIDMAACRARGIAVVPATGANAVSVAEYVIAALLLLVRPVYGAGAEVLGGGWPRQRLVGGELAGRTLGLVGFGDIARAVARRAAALDMRLVAHDPLLPEDDPAWAMAERAELAELLARADAVSLHVPLTENTRGLIGAEAIGRMKRGAFLINTARGGIVDEAALAAALREGRLGGAALDVFADEPLPAGNPLGGAPNLIATPHIAGQTRESNDRVARMVAAGVLRHLGLA